MMKQYDTKEYLAKVDAWWRAADLFISRANVFKS